MKFEIVKTANGIWNKVASCSAPGQVDFEVELYKKLLNFFHVGDYYYAIFNYQKNDFEFISKDVEFVLGYLQIEHGVPLLLSNIHPQDSTDFLNFENKAINFLISLPIDKLMKYKIRHDFRIKKKNGDYVRLLQQGLVIEHDENGGILRTLIIHTDITHLKPYGKPVLSFIGLEGEPSYINVDVENVFTASKEVLTKREKEILTLLIEGKLSKEIAEILYICKETVDRHRKNMLSKNNLHNTGELIGKAIKEGWL